MMYENGVALAGERSSFDFGAASLMSNLNRRPCRHHGLLPRHKSRARGANFFACLGRPPTAAQDEEEFMEVIYPRCAALDVHKKSVVAHVIIHGQRETLTFGTMTKDLLELKKWLLDLKVTHVAMESAGVYWKPIYNLLEDTFTLLVVNAQHIKAVPGRKTDVKDAEWIADLLRHGLLRGSYIPDRPQRELKEIVRYRRILIRERSRIICRIQKVLEGANIKLSSVASDIVGMSGRAILRAMISGIDDPKELAAMAKGKLRKKTQSLEDALLGLMGTHQRRLLEYELEHIDFLDLKIAGLDNDISERMRPYDSIIELIDTVHGIGRRGAEEILAEIGPDVVSRFPDAHHLASWAKICPGNNESAGKRKSGKTGHGNPWLRSVLVETAWAAVRVKGGYYSSLYHRLAGRRGPKRAIVAVAHSILVTIYSMLKNNTVYKDLGECFHDLIKPEQVLRRAIKRIERLGYKVSVDTPLLIT
jgi:transposase